MTPTELRFGAYRVWELDSRNICLEFDTGRQAKDRDGNDKPGETIKELVGYYDSIAPSLKSALRHGLKGRGATDANKVIKAIEAAEGVASMSTEDTALARALRVLDDLPDPELIEVASVIEDDAKRALERRDQVRGALLRRMNAREATVLADEDGCVAVELKEKREYEWDSDTLALAFSPKERDKYLRWVEPSPGRWTARSATAINNLIQKLGKDPKAAQLEAARKVRVQSYISFVKE